jgi:hypothetical protein
MAAAHIKNHPERVYDPQEKLIMDMRSEIRKLRDENKALRDSLQNIPTIIHESKSANLSRVHSKRPHAGHPATSKPLPDKVGNG